MLKSALLVTAVVAVTARADTPRSDPWADPDAAPATAHAAPRARAHENVQRAFDKYFSLMMGTVGMVRNLERERTDEVDVARARLDAIIDHVDQLIAARRYEEAKLEASKIRWPHHESGSDEQYTRDYASLRAARMEVIELHLPR
jgi:hypothetical protein